MKFPNNDAFASESQRRKEFQYAETQKRRDAEMQIRSETQTCSETLSSREPKTQRRGAINKSKHQDAERRDAET